MHAPGEEHRARERRPTAPYSVAFWLVAAAFGVTMLGTTLPTPLYVIYQRELRFSTLVITLIYAAYAVGVLAALLLFGRLSDEIGRRRALLPGLAASVLSAVVFLVAYDDLELLFVGRVLSGISAGIFTGTATAALVDLAGRRGTGRASLVATVVNMGGLGSGPLLAGLLAQFAPDPLRLPYAVDLGLLIAVAAGVWFMPEPVRPGGSSGTGSDADADPGSGSGSGTGSGTGPPPARTGRRRPRVMRPSVPPQVRGVFLRAAIAGFAGFSVLGLFTAVAPSFLGSVLDMPSLALSGGVVFSVFAASTAGQILLVPRFGGASLAAGCTGLVLGMSLLTAALAVESFELLVAAGLVAGLGQGMSFRAGLTAVNAAAPASRRAAVASTFFIVIYVALSLPVVGVGIATDLAGLRVAGIGFSVAVAVLAGSVLAALLRHRNDAGAASGTPGGSSSP
ncbi:Predicted arabinose efflux permease, MFS family [Streptomyces sp. WMMB 714]|uniref:MFS transporter n=1 Tax=Streptomyces sp. WMMB 714 TaxID=1286822 RepID=UPI0005F86F4D|nr:MFS transporter [Streptomyces sp. WMMB 714]SCK49727.1 Predicted arabinose efflux permease, MFS family [Streptomyces sp. WMMB 714]